MRRPKRVLIESRAAIRRLKDAPSVLQIRAIKPAQRNLHLEAGPLASSSFHQNFPKARMQGFTLVELLIAMAIFTLVSLGAYTGLNQILSAQGQLNEYRADLADIQKTVMMIERDLLQMTDRPVRNELGDMEPAVRMGDEVLEWTRLGRFGPADLAQSTLWRIGYARHDDELVRYTWSVIDRAQDSERFEDVVVDGVDAFVVKALYQGEWLNIWPPDETRSVQNVRLAARPEGIRFSLDAGRLPVITRTVFFTSGSAISSSSDDG